jgi:hypothetical protein
MSTPTDCPSREKRGWTGDAQSAAETLIYNFDMSVAYTLRLINALCHDAIPGIRARIAPGSDCGALFNV